jgi:DHA3 family macrolide efflux protein-like MFS transporter
MSSRIGACLTDDSGSIRCRMLGRFGRTLAIPDLRRLVFSTTISQLGDRLTHMLLISLIALSRPGSLLGYSQGALAFALPTLLLSPFVGVLVDRWDKRRVLAITHFIQSGLLLVTPLLIVLSGSFIPFWVALFLFFGLDVFNNTAHPALLPALVPEDHILAANSVNLTFARAATVAGMVIGGYLIRWVGWKLGIMIDASTHFVAGLFALSIATRLAGTSAAPVRGEIRTALPRFFAELREVLQLVGRDRLVALVMGSIVASTFVSAVAYTVLIFLVQQKLGLGTAGVGIFTGIIAVGMIAGAASMSALPQNVNRPLVVVGVIILFGILFVAGWFHVSIPFLAVVALIVGVAYSWLGVVQNTILQEQVSPGIRGRIFSTHSVITNATFIATTLLIGALGELTSYRVVFPVAGLILVAAGAAGLVFVKRTGGLRPAV